MKAFYNIILILAAAAALASCTIDEIDNVGHKKEVKFVVRPTSLMSCNVSDISTKVPYETKAASDFESDIYSAYFLVFDKDGNRIDYRILDVEDSNIPSQIVTPNVEGTISACFIANVPEEYAASLEEIDDLYNVPLDFTYSTSTDGSDDECIAIPDLDGIPMFGWVTGYSIADNLGATTPISLKRLFAKVNVSFQMNLSSDFWSELTGWFQNLFGTAPPDPYFRLDSYTLTNLPKQVKLMHQKNSNGNYADSNYEWFDYPVTVVPDSPIFLNNGESGISFSFYVPEYILNPQITGNSDQTNKTPALLGEYDRPVFLTFSGFYNDGKNPTELDYNVYLGEDAINDFSLLGNNIYNNILNIINADHLSVGFDNRVEIKPLNLVEYYGEAANCYVISKPGTYLIEAYEGVVKSPSGEPDFTGTPELIANDGKNTIVIDEDSGRDGKIIFTVNDGTGTVSHGNAVIGIYNGGIKWSWHIWFSEDPVTVQEDTKTSATMMGRNLGSSRASATDGMYYIWGDKDPYFTANSKSGYWGEGDSDGDWEGSIKTTTDPCPPGYKVPSNNAWLSEDDWGKTAAALDKTGTINMSYFNYSLSPLIVYPYSGYINENGKKISKLQETIDNYTPEDEVIGDIDVPTPGSSSYSLPTPKRYRYITYEYEFDFDTGFSHSTDGYYKFGHNNDILSSWIPNLNITIKSFERQKGSLVKGEHYEEEGRFIKKYIFKDLAPYWDSNNWEPVEVTTWYLLSNSDEISDIKNMIKNYLTEQGYDQKVYSINTTPNKTHGYQIRCVKEE